MVEGFGCCLIIVMLVCKSSGFLASSEDRAKVPRPPYQSSATLYRRSHLFQITDGKLMAIKVNARTTIPLEQLYQIKTMRYSPKPATHSAYASFSIPKWDSEIHSIYYGKQDPNIRIYILISETPDNNLGSYYNISID